jgi:hypothetical protein
LSGAYHVSQPLGCSSRALDPTATQTVRCTPDSPVPWPRQSTVEVCGSRPLDPTVARLSGAHQTVRCHSLRVLVVGLSAQTVRCPTGQSGAHQTCDCSLSGAPPVRWLTTLFLDFFANSFGLLLFLSLGLLCFFLCFLLRCCILIALVQSSLHPMNYKHKH